MIVDYSAGTDDLIGGRVLVNGTEIHQAWYIDTIKGEVKSYDVMGDRQAHSTYECSVSLPPLADLLALGIQVERNVILSKTVTGKVELFRRIPDIDPPLYEPYAPHD